jgi:hypothetical protein
MSTMAELLASTAAFFPSMSQVPIAGTETWTKALLFAEIPKSFPAIPTSKPGSC